MQNIRSYNCWRLMRINHFIIGKLKHCYVFAIHAILSLRPQDRQAGNEKELKKNFKKSLQIKNEHGILLLAASVIRQWTKEIDL
ncbi:hypothetical protein ASG89_33820 [Paenibacillus sp. Soil766]|nr:hypothetical protein ASG89_33820 [Paenibacillus sp. Soil766]